VPDFSQEIVKVLSVLQSTSNHFLSFRFVGGSLELFASRIGRFAVPLDLPFLFQQPLTERAVTLVDGRANRSRMVAILDATIHACEALHVIGFLLAKSKPRTQGRLVKC
jgi:hypothetical protein